MECDYSINPDILKSATNAVGNALKEVTPDQIVSAENTHSVDTDVIRNFTSLGLDAEHHYGGYGTPDWNYIIDELKSGNQIAQPASTSNDYGRWLAFLDYNEDTNQIFVADAYEESGWDSVKELAERCNQSSSVFKRTY